MSNRLSRAMDKIDKTLGSQRIQRVQTPIIPVVGKLIQDNPGTISLGQGVVYYGPPPSALDAAEQCFSDANNHRYGAVHGIAELRRAAADKLARQNGMQVSPDDIVVSAGSNMGFYNTLLAISDPGDEIILAHPYYFNHEMAITMAGCVPVTVSTGRGYQLDPADIASAITAKTRAVVTISPNNPTGAVYTELTLTAINQLCRDHDLYHLSDEAYEDFVYQERNHFSPASLNNAKAHTISLFSLSKAYGFAGWRIGYTAMPAQLVEPVMKIQDTVLICPSLVSQRAAVAALSDGKAYCCSKLGLILKVREYLLDRLQELGGLIDTPVSDGAFYILLRVHTDMDDTVLVKRLIREYQVAVIPGSAFGIRTGCFIRVAFAALVQSTAQCAIDRLIKGLVDLVGTGK